MDVFRRFSQEIWKEYNKKFEKKYISWRKYDIVDTEHQITSWLFLLLSIPKASITKLGRVDNNRIKSVWSLILDNYILFLATGTSIELENTAD